MAPVPRAVQLLGLSLFGVIHSVIRTMLIFGMAVPFFDVTIAGSMNQSQKY